MRIHHLIISGLLILFCLSCAQKPQAPAHQLMKGIAYRQLEPEGEECTDLENLNVSWYYNWTPEPNCPGDGHTEFIPMIWSEHYLVDGNYEKYLVPLIGSDYAALLGYNEPNWEGQAEMTVEEALRYWPLLERTGLRLGSPATTGRSGLDWTIEFMNGAKERGYRIDFLALHWYGDCSGTGDLKGFLDYYDAFAMPMWLTEWSCYKEDMATNTAFLGKIIPVLESYERLERYAWYSNRTTSESYAGAALFDPAGKPTPAGEIYINLPAIHTNAIREESLPDIELEIVDWHEGPVIGKGDPGARGAHRCDTPGRPGGPQARPPVGGRAR